MAALRGEADLIRREADIAIEGPLRRGFLLHHRELPLHPLPCSQARRIVPGNWGVGPVDGDAPPWFLMLKR